jgi:hypothetical protein
MLALSLLVAAYEPPPPPPPGTPPTTIADLIRIEGHCSLSVLIVGDDALSTQFNSAVINAAAKAEGGFCRRANGNYVIYTNSNVRPTHRTKDYFRYLVTVHDARDFIANHDAGAWRTLASDEKECQGAASVCANNAVNKVLTELEAQ